MKESTDASTSVERVHDFLLTLTVALFSIASVTFPWSYVQGVPQRRVGKHGKRRPSASSKYTHYPSLALTAKRTASEPQVSLVLTLFCAAEKPVEQYSINFLKQVLASCRSERGSSLENASPSEQASILLPSTLLSLTAGIMDSHPTCDKNKTMLHDQSNVPPFFVALQPSSDPPPPPWYACLRMTVTLLTVSDAKPCFWNFARTRASIRTRLLARASARASACAIYIFGVR